MHERLRRSPDIVRALRSGVRRHGTHVVVHGVDRRDGRPARVGVLASRRVGGAVQRNRAKRVLREAVRPLELPLGHDVLLVARREAATCSMHDVQRDLEDVLGRLGLGRPLEHAFES